MQKKYTVYYIQAKGWYINCDTIKAHSVQHARELFNNKHDELTCFVETIVVAGGLADKRRSANRYQRPQTQKERRADRHVRHSAAVTFA